MRRTRGRWLALSAVASLLITANSFAKDRDTSGPEDDHSVPLPPQPEPPPGIENESAPVELDTLPPPPPPPRGARKRRRTSIARAKVQASQSQRDLAPSLSEKDAPSGGKWYGAQTLALDGTALAMLAFGVARQDEF